jgi:DNA-directed RNA polymerase specialized sigma24 family protein
VSQRGPDHRFLDVDYRESWDDERLLRSRTAPDETFATFYRRHVRVILGFYAQRRVDVTIAGDLTAETFAAALLARYRYKAQQPSARAWLLTIASNKLADH